jgi:hypothetical protein
LLASPGAVVEVVAVHPVLVLEMPDHQFDGVAAAHLAFDLRGEAALLLGRTSSRSTLFDRRDDLCERVSIIKIAGQRLGMDGELAALAAFEGGGDADLDAELVGLVRLAFANAFDFGSVQAVDLGCSRPMRSIG